MGNLMMENTVLPHFFSQDGVLVFSVLFSVVMDSQVQETGLCFCSVKHLACLGDLNQQLRRRVKANFFTSKSSFLICLNARTADSDSSY